MEDAGSNKDRLSPKRPGFVPHEKLEVKSKFFLFLHITKQFSSLNLNN